MTSLAAAVPEGGGSEEAIFSCFPVTITERISPSNASPTFMAN